MSTPAESWYSPAELQLLTDYLTRDAEFIADLVLKFLGQLENDRPQTLDKQPLRFPAEFLLELAAVLRILIWERDQLLERIDADLPRFDDAYGQLVSRAAHSPESFSYERVRPPLYQKVMAVVFDQFAWNGRPELGADVLLSPIDSGDEDRVLDALAAFLWGGRRPPGTSLPE